MKLKYLLGIGMACSMICSCSEEYMSFEGTDRIQFKIKAFRHTLFSDTTFVIRKNS